VLASLAVSLIAANSTSAIFFVNISIGTNTPFENSRSKTLLLLHCEFVTRIGSKRINF